MGLPDQADWRWDLDAPDEWIDLFLVPTGLRYVGWDMAGQAGGAYMAGSQSFDDFARDGGLNDIPEAVAASVRERVAALGARHPVRVEIAGPTPDEAHLSLDEQPLILFERAVLFDGSLPTGEHLLRGILLYPGTDDQGRRVARRFELPFTVTGPVVLTVAETQPRWG